jgi:hypothetical protein
MWRIGFRVTKGEAGHACRVHVSCFRGETFSERGDVFLSVDAGDELGPELVDAGVTLKVEPCE